MKHSLTITLKRLAAAIVAAASLLTAAPVVMAQSNGFIPTNLVIAPGADESELNLCRYAPTSTDNAIVRCTRGDWYELF